MKKLSYFVILSFGLLTGCHSAQAEEDGYCREFTKEVKIDNKIETAYGVACLEEDGAWRIVSEGEDEDNVREVERIVYIGTNHPHYRFRNRISRPSLRLSFLYPFGSFHYGGHRYGHDYRYKNRRHKHGFFKDRDRDRYRDKKYKKKRFGKSDHRYRGEYKRKDRDRDGGRKSSNDRKKDRSEKRGS